MTPRVSNRRTSRTKIAAWPWWQLIVSGQGTQLSGRARAKLSPHLLNLRADLISPPPLVPELRPALTQRESVDFAPVGFEIASLVPPPLPKLLGRWPGLARLTLVACLDLVWCFVGTAVLAAAYAFVRLGVELRVIGQSIWTDVQTYAHTVRQVFRIPFLAVLPSRLANAPMPRSTRRFTAAISFAAVALTLILPLKGIAMLGQVGEQSHIAAEFAQEGLAQLALGADELSRGQANSAADSFTQAATLFDRALDSLGGLPQPIVDLLGRVPGPTAELSSGVHVLSASREASKAAASAAAAWARASSSEVVPASLSDHLIALQQATSEVEPYLRGAMVNLRNVSPAGLPPALRPRLAGLVGQLGAIEQLLTSMTVLPGFLQQVLAPTTPRRYVVLFQNPSELRPTGGFLGSLGFIELSGGKVDKLTIPGGGTYDFQGSLSSVRRPPEPMRVVRGTWQLQDANWFFDFPTSAQKVLWFLNKSGVPPSDGVIAVTADVVAKLLTVTGPIELPAYHKVLTADNFVSETQAAVELEFDPAANRPKQFISDLAPLLFDRLAKLDSEHQLALLSLLQGALYERGVQVYLTDESLEQQVRNFGWSGEVKSTSLDYLAVVRANIGGGKTDAVTDENLRYEVEVQPSGQLVAHLTFTRHHDGDPRGAFTWRRNQDYVRFYVPQGSTLISADGFTPLPSEYFRDVPASAVPDDDLMAVEHNPSVDTASGMRTTEEFGKTVFGNWLNVMPGATQTVHLTYSLPFTLEPGSSWQDLRRYAVYFQRQAGVRPIDFSSAISFPDGWRVRWQEGSEALVSEPGKVELKGNLAHDEYYGVVLEKLGNDTSAGGGLGT